jgi:hypothetical protein
MHLALNGNEHAIEKLNTSEQLEAMLQGLCSEGSVDEFWVEEKDGEVSVSWTESVYSGLSRPGFQE